MPPETDTERDPEEVRQEREKLARESNSRRNAERIARMESIADSTEAHDPEHREMEEVTDEMLADEGLSEEQANARAMARAQARKPEGEEQEDPAADASAENDQVEERRDDEAREAGADDVRIVNGVKEYRLLINGHEKWQTLAQIRASAQKVESADEYLQTAADTVRKATRSAQPSPEEVQQAERTKQERRTRVKELLKRQALGDEQAIDELAELIDATPSAVTPDVLRALDERFDSRVTFRDAVTWFEGEYANELRHPAMKSYAGELDAALAAQDRTLSPKQRLKQVGEQIRRELKETYGLAAAPAGPSDKARRKAEGTRRLTTAGERQQTRTEEEEAESTQTVIQRMAESRHQPRAVVHGPIRGR